MNDLINADNVLSPFISKRLAHFEREVKAIKEAEDLLKKAILEEMEEKGIVKVETDDLVLTYVAPTDREKFDTKRLRSEQPEIFDEYVDIIPVKASIRLKVK